MDSFHWWNDEHRRLAAELEEFVEKVMPKAEEAWWKRQIPKDIFNEIAEKGFFGVAIPKAYGGMGLGATGASITMEAIAQLPGLFYVFGASMMGGLHQIIEFGTEEQKRRFLTRMAKGELGAISITEPFVGSDASAIETVARREGDLYILSGKKRFTTGIGISKRYMLYARTSNDPKEIAQYKHLTAFIVEKGMPGFSVEKVNEIMGYDNTPNGYLNLDEVAVPIENRIGQEGEGWRVMTVGLNFERTIIAASLLGLFRVALRSLVGYGQRRIQFGRPTIEFVNNQFKIADLIVKYKLSRLVTYYSAYLFDSGQDPSLEASISKLYNSDMCMEAMIDAIQMMGGDGVTKFYPLERLFREAKTNQIAGGTNEAIKLIIYRMGLRQMSKDLKWPKRRIHPELGIPISMDNNKEKSSEVNEERLLKVLAEDYRINPGLYMSREDIKDIFEVEDNKLDELLVSLEQKNLAKLYRGKKGIELVKATYEGLKKANPKQYYQWFPSWFKKEDLF